MTTPLIEAIARKQCEQHIREVRRWDTDPSKLEAMLPGAVDVNWQDHIALAQAALTAITEAGYQLTRVIDEDEAQRIMARSIVEYQASTAISAAQGDG